MSKNTEPGVERIGNPGGIAGRTSWGGMLALALLALACNGGIDQSASTDVVPTTVMDTPSTTVAEAAPTTAPEAAPTTVVETTTTTIDAEEAAWLARAPEWPGEGSGEYRTRTFGIPFLFSTGGTEWHTSIEAVDWLYFQSDFGGLDVFPVEGPVEQVTAEWAQMHDSFEDASMAEPESITVGGAEGVRFESVGLPVNTANVADPTPILFSANDGGVPAGPAGIIYVVDVAGQTVVLAFNESIFDPEPGEIEAAAEQAIVLIGSIVWKALG